MARYDKDAWKSQAKAAILGGLASELTTTLIKAPFEEPRQRFLLHDQKGKELNRKYKELSTEQSYYDTTRKTIDASKQDGLTWFQNKHLDAMKAHLGDRYTDYADDVFVQNGMGALREEANRLGQEEYDEFIAGEKRLSVIPDRATFEARVDRYSPRSKNWGQALFRRGRRFVRGQSYEDFADDSIRSMTAGTGLDLTDEEIIEIRKEGIQARRPVNKEGVLAAVEKVLGTREVRVGMEQEMQARRNGLAITADRLELEHQYREGTMDKTVRVVYGDLYGKGLAKKDGHSPSTPEVVAAMRKNFKDSFIADDSVTRDNMLNEWKKDSEVQGYQAQMYDSIAVWLTQDESAEGGYAFDQLKNKDDIDAVKDKAEAIFDRVYSVARDRTLVQLQRAYDEEALPRDYLGGTPSARMLQKQMMFDNATSILLGGLEKGTGKNVVVNQRTGWWDTKEARQYLTGAIVAPTSEEFIQGVMDKINQVGAQANQHMPAMAAADAEDDTGTTDATATTATAEEEAATATMELPEQSQVILARLTEEKGKHYRSETERKRAEDRMRTDGRRIITSAATSFSKNNPDAHPDEQWEATQGRIKGLSEELDVDFGSTPSSKGSGLGQDKKDPVQFSMAESPFINKDVDEVLRADKPDEEFSLEVKKDGSVDINFQGTETRKPSDWSISKLTPDNNINIDNITDMKIYNHLRYLAAEYSGASKEDKPHIIDKVDFGYGEEDAGEILLWEDKALVQDLFSQFNERYLREDDDDDDRSPSFLSGATSLETWRPSEAKQLRTKIPPAGGPSLLAL